MKITITRSTLATVLFAVTALLAACGKSSDPASPASTAREPAKTPLVQKAVVADWCPEHAVPESICTRCNTNLIADFQAKGDWCKEHSMPETQCVACHPELEAKFKAMAPKSGG